MQPLTIQSFAKNAPATERIFELPQRAPPLACYWCYQPRFLRFFVYVVVIVVAVVISHVCDFSCRISAIASLLAPNSKPIVYSFLCGFMFSRLQSVDNSFFFPSSGDRVLCICTVVVPCASLSAYHVSMATTAADKTHITWLLCDFWCISAA